MSLARPAAPNPTAPRHREARSAVVIQEPRGKPWRLMRLDECTEIVSGSTPSTSVAAYWDGDINWATPKDLGNLEGPSINETPRKITQAGLDSCGANILPAGSVLFSSRAPIGHVAINTVPMATNQGFKSFRPNPKLLVAGYLYHWLRCNRAYLESLGNGATFKEVSKAVVARIELPVPPLPEQRRIAAILDQADALRAKRRAALAQLDEMAQAIFVDMFGADGFKAPKTSAEPLGGVVQKATIVTYGIVQAGEEFEGGVPYIRTGDLVNGQIRLDGLRHTDPTLAAKFARSRVRAGEIVMSIRATVGTTALVPAELDGANLTQGTARIAPGDRTDRRYLLEFLRSKSTQEWIAKQVKGATFREITLQRLRELPVAVPPLNLQQKFGKRVSVLQRQLELSQSSLAELDSLFASLQHRAFRGEL